MGFYDDISIYYDKIFSTGKSQLEFIKNAAGTPPKNILDVACGSGGYSIELAKAGYKVWAVDLDEKMIGIAVKRAKDENTDLIAAKSDMLELKNTVRQKFDCIFCIGNSLVHLTGADKITEALSQMHDLLYDNGCLILQIINYDRILDKKITSLPEIKNEAEGISFTREYMYKPEKGLIDFNTKLTVQKDMAEKRVFENSVELFPLRSGELLKILEKCGFASIKFFGDFESNPYIPEDSFMIVVHAKK